MSQNKKMNFIVYSLCKEININAIADQFGIKKRFNWEDYLSLREKDLKGILNDSSNKLVNLYPFGSIVFINLAHSEIVDVINYLSKVDKNLLDYSLEFKDDYSLEIIEEEASFDNDRMISPIYKDYMQQIISIVLAKSVSLEKIEKDISILLDEVETVITLLNKGDLKSKDQKIAKISARVLSFKYNTLSYIMLLDKPDITWDNQDAEKLYTDLSHLFELDERYQKIQAKADTLMDIIDVFSTLTQHKKANTLEWMIIILILIEIFITLADYTYKFLIK
jgi:uncharacterized Rmd1/YagE family protein